MARVLKMSKRDDRDEKGLTRMPELLSSEISEEQAATAKIEKWLRLADTVLTQHQPAHVEFPHPAIEKRSKQRRS